MKVYPYLSAFINSINQGKLDFQHKLKSDFTISGEDENGSFYQKFQPVDEEKGFCIMIGNTIFKSIEKIYK